MSREAKEKLHDRICYVILKAPDRFPDDTGMNLDNAYAEMHESLDKFCDSASKEHQSIKELLEGSYRSYLDSEQKQAIQQLQCIENFLSGRTNELSRNS